MRDSHLLNANQVKTCTHVRAQSVMLNKCQQDCTPAPIREPTRVDCQPLSVLLAPCCQATTFNHPCACLFFSCISSTSWIYLRMNVKKAGDAMGTPALLSPWLCAALRMQLKMLLGCARSGTRVTAFAEVSTARGRAGLQGIFLVLQPGLRPG